MTDDDKEIKRLLKLPLSDKLTRVLEQLSIIYSREEDEDDKSLH